MEADPNPTQITETTHRKEYRMIYITYSQPARYHQLTFEEMMAGITVNDIAELRTCTASGT